MIHYHSTMEKGQRFSALYTRDFRLFWFGQIISLSGTWMHSLAQSWLVYSLTKSPLYLGIIASAASLPILFFTLFGGMVADRFPKRNILVATQTLSMLLALVIAVLAGEGIIQVWHVGVVAALLGTVNAFDVPARQAFLAEVVEKADITNAIALNSAAFNGARIVGPVIAGFIIAGVGIPACFFINAVSFIPVIIALTRIKARITTRTYDKGLFKDMADGWRFVSGEKEVLAIMSWIALFSLLGIPYVTLLPVLAGEVLSVGARGLSLLMAFAGAGSLIAAMTIAFRGDVRRKDLFIPLSGLVFSAAILGISFSSSFHLSLALILCAGWGVVSFLATSNGFIQQAVPDSLRGRVMSVYTLVFLGLAPIGNSLIGFTAHFMGTVPSLKLFAALCILGSLLLSRSFRRAFSRAEALPKGE